MIELLTKLRKHRGGRPPLERTFHRFCARQLKKLFCSALFALFFCSPQLALAQSIIEDIRMLDLQDATEVTLTLDAPFRYRLFALRDPDRVVVDLFNSRLKTASAINQDQANKRLKNIRHARRNKNDYRVVFELRRPATISKRASVKKSKYTLTIAIKSNLIEQSKDLRKVIVFIDPGHGGRDPGAIGEGGTREKEVAMSVAKTLYKLLENDFGIKPLLTRNKDVGISLKKRLRNARENRADAFLSLHVDSVGESYVRGASVYVLSAKGARSASVRLLEKRENLYSHDEELNLAEIDEDVSNIIVDMSLSSVKTHSLMLAGNLLAGLRKVAPIRANEILHGNFAVLKSPDSPSALVELGYISNPQEEDLLKTKDYQQRLAKALVSGLHAYFNQNANRDTLLANYYLQDYLVRKGDTLSFIAARMNSTVAMIASASHLKTQRIYVGQRLSVPTSKTAR